MFINKKDGGICMGIIGFLKTLTNHKSDAISELGKLGELELKVLEAKKDWQAAQKVCDEVTDPKHLDNAILKAVRAERKYMHYLKLVKQSTGKGTS